MATAPNAQSRRKASDDERLRHVEQVVGVLGTQVEDIRNGQRELVNEVRKLADALAKVPEKHTMREHLITAGIVATLCVSVLAGMNWWFTASYQQAATPFLTQMTSHERFLRPLVEEGKLYRLFDRVERLEEAVEWRAQFEDATPGS